jgi:hypothetical protein
VAAFYSGQRSLKFKSIILVKSYFIFSCVWLFRVK